MGEPIYGPGKDNYGREKKITPSRCYEGILSETQSLKSPLGRCGEVLRAAKNLIPSEIELEDVFENGLEEMLGISPYCVREGRAKMTDMADTDRITTLIAALIAEIEDITGGEDE